ncbi:unnamed protein product, partial [Musa acuminata subsp. burmannicoides]
MAEGDDQMGVGCGRGGRRGSGAETGGARSRPCWSSRRETRWRVGFEQRRKGPSRWSGLRRRLKEGSSVCSERKCWMLVSERADRVPGGYHEYIDVIARGGARYIVDINLAAEFEIARPTTDYVMLLRVLPAVFVGSRDL